MYTDFPSNLGYGELCHPINLSTIVLNILYPCSSHIFLTLSYYPKVIIAEPNPSGCNF